VIPNVETAQSLSFAQEVLSRGPFGQNINLWKRNHLGLLLFHMYIEGILGISSWNATSRHTSPFLGPLAYRLTSSSLTFTISRFLSPHLEPWRCRPLSSGWHCPRFLLYAWSACLSLLCLRRRLCLSAALALFLLRHRQLGAYQLLHRFANQRAHITRLIAVYGPTRRVSVTSARCPDHVIVAALSECLSIGELLSIENFIILDDHSS